MVRREQTASRRRGVRLHQRRLCTGSCHQLARGQDQHADGSHLESRSHAGLYLASARCRCECECEMTLKLAPFYRHKREPSHRASQLGVASLATTDESAPTCSLYNCLSLPYMKHILLLATG
jgi:hypothetical protein